MHKNSDRESNFSEELVRTVFYDATDKSNVKDNRSVLVDIFP